MDIPNDTMVTNLPRGNHSRGDFIPSLTVMKSVSQLKVLLAGRWPAPSKTLIQIFQLCANDPTEKIKEIVKDMGEQFQAEFTRQNSNLPTVSISYAKQTFQLAVMLFYKFIENILQNEKNLHNDISHLTVKDIVYKCILACSLEIIMHCYNCQRNFPWILNALKIEPFYFIRVIELIVRSQYQLPRDAVKHLDMVQQEILDSLMWKSKSSIWEVLKNTREFPKFEDTVLPGNVIYTEEKAASGSNLCKPSNDILQFPGFSAAPKQFLKTTPIAKQIIVIDKGGNRVSQVQNKQLEALIPKTENLKQESCSSAATASRNKKIGSLEIILRKFYNLAYSRMEKLCKSLDISELKLRQRIWTIFEHSVREHTDFMRDRHLDQLLMCAVYVVCNVTSAKDIEFFEILGCYKTQSQARSHIYKNVLITRGNINRESENSDQINKNPVESKVEKRGHLISFYDTVYVNAMYSFVLQFSSHLDQNANITLSSLPLLVNNDLTSVKYPIANNVYIQPYCTQTANVVNINKGKILKYHFGRGSSNDLKKINKSIVSKRLLGDEVPPNKRFVNKKM